MKYRDVKVGDVVQLRKGCYVMWRNEMIPVSTTKELTVKIFTIEKIAEVGEAEVVFSDGNIPVGDNVSFLVETASFPGNSLPKLRSSSNAGLPKI